MLVCIFFLQLTLSDQVRYHARPWGITVQIRVTGMLCPQGSHVCGVERVSWLAVVNTLRWRFHETVRYRVWSVRDGIDPSGAPALISAGVHSSRGDCDGQWAEDRALGPPALRKDPRGSQRGIVGRGRENQDMVVSWGCVSSTMLLTSLTQNLPFLSSCELSARLQSDSSMSTHHP